MYVLGTGTQMMNHSWNLQDNDSGTLHLVINEEMEDWRKKIMSVCACVHMCACLKSHIGENTGIHNKHKTKKPNHDPHMHPILQPN